MSSSNLFWQAVELGYGIQTLLPAAQLAEHLPKLPANLEMLWIVCNVGDEVQRRWLAGCAPEVLLQDNLLAGPASAGPLDDFCMQELTSLLGERPHLFLFPHAYGEPLFPLLPVLKAAGLLRTSPIMSSLHERYGSWWAVRAVIALAAPLPPWPQAALGELPCLNCAAPCVNACPANAVQLAGWNFTVCSEYRTRSNSPCAASCMARLACPVGLEFRYRESVLAYHYGVSLQSLQRA